MISHRQKFVVVKIILSKILIFVAVAVSAFVLKSDAYAKLYVYEVVTETRTFQTVSKMSPSSFLYYNGGTDIIKSLSILEIYNDSEHKKAVEEYKLDESNVRQLPHSSNGNKQDNESVADVSRHSGAYYWWR